MSHFPFKYEQRAIDKGYTHIAGVDEVGLGPIAGPIYATAVILDFKKLYLLSTRFRLIRKVKKIRVKDSKQLSPLEREALYPGIMENCVSYGIGKVEVDEIERVKNIMKCGQLARRRAIEALEVKPDFLLIDGPFPIPELKIPGVAIIKGDDKSVSIAAASIIAKVQRDRLMIGLSKKFPMYDWGNNVGYKTPRHWIGVASHGFCKHHRHYLIKKVRG